MRISDWSSDVCSSDLAQARYRQHPEACTVEVRDDGSLRVRFARNQRAVTPGQSLVLYDGERCLGGAVIAATDAPLERRQQEQAARSEEHTSELQSLMRISYAVFCLKKKNTKTQQSPTAHDT